MIPNQALQKAKAAGWTPTDTTHWQVTALDPEFWNALARATNHKGHWFPLTPLFFELVLTGSSIGTYWKDVFGVDSEGD